MPVEIRTGITEWASELSEQELRAVTRDDAHYETLRALGLKAYIIAPMGPRRET